MNLKLFPAVIPAQRDYTQFLLNVFGTVYKPVADSTTDGCDICVPLIINLQICM